jgi:putative thiamine transport system substrate-binding protein
MIIDVSVRRESIRVSFGENVSRLNDKHISKETTLTVCVTTGHQRCLLALMQARRYSHVMLKIIKQSLLVLALLGVFTSGSSAFDETDELWRSTVERARGGEVYLNAWGGNEAVNQYLQWADGELRRRYQIRLTHMRVASTGDVVSRVLAEKAAGRDTGGSVDLIWINGENFSAMQQQSLLLPPWTMDLPNYRYVDEVGKPSVVIDFSTPVNHQEMPWGMAQLVFYHDSARVPEPPRSMHDLLRYARNNPGRVSYPAPPDFHGTTFLKQALLELSESTDFLYQPASQNDIDERLAVLWEFLDELHAVAWQRGNRFPVDGPRVKQMLSDGELHIAFSFNPAEAVNGVVSGELPATARSYVHHGGTLGNTHFLAMPYNANAVDAAKVVSNFLLSAEAQARKADPLIWGDPTVLALDKLPAEQRALFEEAGHHPAMPAPSALQQVLLEPDASWVRVLEREWQRRYAR